jgi:hypothetical protein
MLLDGLLGGIVGGSNAVNQLSEERRKALAEQVKMEALEAMQTRMQERGYKHAEAMQGKQFEHAEGMQGNQFKHAEGMQTNQFGHAESMADKQFGHNQLLQRERFGHESGLLDKRLGHESGLLDKRLSHEKGLTTEKPLMEREKAFTQIEAIYDQAVKEGKWKEGKKLPEYVLRQVNDIRQAAGMSPLSEKESGKDGWFSSKTYSYSDQPEVKTTEKEGAEKSSAKETGGKEPGFVGWKDYMTEDPTANQKLPQTQTNGLNSKVRSDINPPQADPQKTAIGEAIQLANRFGVNPNSMGRHKRVLWEKLSSEAKEFFGTPDNMTKLLAGQK